jgi:RNA polymerase sigma-70 factor (ECF subfamily)
MTGRPRDAEELAEETLVRAWRALSDYSPERRRTLRLRPWLFQIAANLARNRARDARRSETLSLDVDAASDTETSLAGRLVDEDPLGAPEAALAAAQRQANLAALLLTLPAPQRIAVILRHVEGMGYAAIAEITGEPVGTVKSHVNRGVARLRQALERERVAEALEVAG